MAVIYITEADNTQHQFRLPDEEGVAVTIGRSEDCHISMPGIEGLSGLHCSISLVGGEYVIKDEGSSNGTLEGERAISAEALREGVAYGIGNALLYFDAELAAPAADEEEPALQPAPAAEEALAEPIPVSEYAAYAPPAPAEEAEAAEEAPVAAAPAPVKKKKKRTVVSPLAQVQSNMAAMKKKRQALDAVSYFYVLLVLLFAFYAGMTLRHWMVTGEYLPRFDATPAKAVKK